MIISNKEIIKYKNGVSEKVSDPVISEEWFYLYLNEQLIYQTPVLDQEIDDLIYGLLYVKGHIKDDIKLTIEKKDRAWFISSKEALPGQSFRVEPQQRIESLHPGSGSSHRSIGALCLSHQSGDRAGGQPDFYSWIGVVGSHARISQFELFLYSVVHPGSHGLVHLFATG